ncbi:GTP pyrophosphokinase [Paenibacillus wynnii]|uniref:RelA/SpoT domain-containing protein n=1 Tax=Paenibacillus wynnii TaxID=268407 RepID=A0A098M8N6_9BACL|nr:RelA/SpoT domain-containing protein [Paenibacillus wynnii]KGE18426.1 hypothetical protein PWYN_28400 [Paenibacillus wynnii]
MEKSRKVQEAVEWYQNNRDFYKRLALKVELIIKEILEYQGINYHSVSSRAKDIDSFAEKASKDKYSNPKEQIKDLAGIRVIAYVEADLSKICEVIEREFIIYSEDSGDKSSSLAINQVGYRSVHYISEFSKSRVELPEFQRFNEVCFEIQVRTILQHAWAEIEHDRSYKFKGVLPNESSIKRRFALLAGLLELADREFDSIVKDIDLYSEVVEGSTSAGDLEIEINSISLHSYLSQRYKTELKKNIVQDYGYHDSSEKIIGELSRYGLTKLSEIDVLIPKNFCENIESVESSEMNFIGLLRLIMVINDYRKYFEKAWRNGWQHMSDDFAEMLQRYDIPVVSLLESYEISCDLFELHFDSEINEGKED